MLSQLDLLHLAEAFAARMPRTPEYALDWTAAWRTIASARLRVDDIASAQRAMHNVDEPCMQAQLRIEAGRWVGKHPASAIGMRRTINTFHAEVTEGAGDAVVSAAVPTPPDLIHGTLDVGGGNLRVTFQFAPGTLGPSTVVTILLDTDQNPATGFNDTGYGIDYVVSLYASTAAFIQKANPSSCASGGNCYTHVGMNRTGIVGGLIPREDVAHGTTEQVLPRTP